MARRRTGQSKFSWLKLLLIVLVIAFIISASIVGYYAFTHQMPAILGAVSFIMIVGLFIWLVIILRKPNMHYRKPSFALVFLSLVGILLVCTFAGIQPLSAYKDSLFNFISNRIRVTSSPVQSDNTSNNTMSETQNIPVVLFWAKIPNGYYESDSHYFGRTFTINGTTLTMDCKIRTEPFGTPDLSWPQMGVHTYEYKLHSISSSLGLPTQPVPLDKANLIYLTDVVNGFTVDIPFKYMPEYNIIQLADETGGVESYRLK